jgi:glutathione S-transferase
LDTECRRVLRFAEASALPDGGFGWLDDAGRPDPDRPVLTWIGARMTHVFAFGRLLGQPGYDRLVGHGVTALAETVGTLCFAVGGSFGLADIAIGSLLGYLGVRFPEKDWRAAYPDLAAYADALFARPSFAATVPVAQSIRDKVV